jgi:uncharacterized membrane protein
MALLIAIHVLAAVVWVGGMFFAYMVLRPAAGPLDPGARLSLWQRVLGRFFAWVWASIGLLLISGFGMIFGYLGGFAAAGVHVHLMVGIGILMMLLFVYLYFSPWRRFAAAIEGGHLPEAGAELSRTRLIVAVNLLLGLATVVVGASGRFW